MQGPLAIAHRINLETCKHCKQSKCRLSLVEGTGYCEVHLISLRTSVSDTTFERSIAYVMAFPDLHGSL